jgi:hypothetical protein
MSTVCGWLACPTQKHKKLLNPVGRGLGFVEHPLPSLPDVQFVGLSPSTNHTVPLHMGLHVLHESNR